MTAAIKESSRSLPLFKNFLTEPSTWNQPKISFSRECTEELLKSILIYLFYLAHVIRSSKAKVLEYVISLLPINNTTLHFHNRVLQIAFWTNLRYSYICIARPSCPTEIRNTITFSQNLQPRKFPTLKSVGNPVSENFKENIFWG